MLCSYDTTPVALHVIVPELEYECDAPIDDVQVATAFAVAELPLLLDVMLLIDQVDA